MILEVDHCFSGGVVKFRKALAKYSAQLGFEYAFLKKTQVGLLLSVSGSKKKAAIGGFIHRSMTLTKHFTFVVMKENIPAVCHFAMRRGVGLIRV